MKVVIFALFFTFCIIGCFGSKSDNISTEELIMKVAPDWYKNETVSDSSIIAIGSAIAKNLSLAKAESKLKANSELIKKVYGVRVESIINSNKKIDEITKKTHLEQFSEKASGHLIGVKTIKSSINKGSDYYIVFVQVEISNSNIDKSILIQAEKNSTFKNFLIENEYYDTLKKTLD